jgi:hypothetical protein
MNEPTTPPTHPNPIFTTPETPLAKNVTNGGVKISPISHPDYFIRGNFLP